MKKYLPYIAALLAILVGVGGYFGYKRFLAPEGNPANRVEIDAILFYGKGCPHCSNVDDYLKKERVDEKVAFEKAEVYYDQNNARLLMEKAEICGFSTASIGVPFLWDGENSRCFIGEIEIKDFFNEILN